MAAHQTRISFQVEAFHLPHIRGCLDNISYHDFAVAPVLAGYDIKGYWSSEAAFHSIGEKVRVSFVADAWAVAPLVAAGFGILQRDVLLIQSSAVVN